MAVRIGISGWRYKPWRGVFYPSDLAQRRELAYASRAMDSIEINGSFYSLQSPDSWRQWRDATPDDFVFSVKGPRYVTHILRLRETDKALANFFASGLLQLGPKLGPVLWQLPPSMKYDAALLEEFFRQLPKNTEAALALAGKRERSRMTGRSSLRAPSRHRLRHALEVRHDSFATPAFIRQLRRHRIALVIADTAGRFPYAEDITAGFLYLRLHGDAELYAGGYSSRALGRWARRIHYWARGQEPADAQKIVDIRPTTRKSRDVYCYFDNDVKVHAPFDAMKLKQRLESGDDGAPHRT